VGNGKCVAEGTGTGVNSSNFMSPITNYHAKGRSSRSCAPSSNLNPEAVLYKQSGRILGNFRDMNAFNADSGIDNSAFLNRNGFSKDNSYFAPGKIAERAQARLNGPQYTNAFQ